MSFGNSCRASFAPLGMAGYRLSCPDARSIVCYPLRHLSQDRRNEPWFDAARGGAFSKPAVFERRRPKLVSTAETTGFLRMLLTRAGMALRTSLRAHRSS